ncbi:MAG: class I SAM-dependent methyltransferase, partial [Gemmataceae bacterium]
MADSNESTESLPQVRLKIERRSSHPWVFQKMVEWPSTKVPNGSVVDVLDKSGQWVGRGFYNGHSRIALRLLTAEPNESIDAAFFADRIGKAVALRREVLKLDAVSDAYRLVHSEADGLSGLVVDRFADTLVIEFFAAGMFRQRGVIQDALLAHFPGANVYYFAEEHVGKQESFDCRPPVPPPPFVITEHGLKFRVAPGSKHKTGFFADQRNSRQRVKWFAKGRNVLDLFCNSGGFGMAAMQGKARKVLAVDLDEEAVDHGKANAQNNNLKVRFEHGDAFDWLRDI